MQNFSLAFVSLFVALDVIGLIPLYLSMTGSMSEKARRKVVDTSMFVALGVAVLFSFVGQSVFRHLGIEIFDFRVAGGIILLLVALADLVGHQEAANRGTGSTGIVPLAVPLITGPAVLTTLILQVNSYGYAVTLLALVANYLLGWVALRNSGVVQRAIGQDGTVAISKIMALLLAAISVAMIRSGVFGAIQGYMLSPQP
jgi:multiple antibiotic resistance protein